MQVGKRVGGSVPARRWRGQFQCRPRAAETWEGEGGGGRGWSGFGVYLQACWWQVGGSGRGVSVSRGRGAAKWQELVVGPACIIYSYMSAISSSPPRLSFSLALLTPSNPSSPCRLLPGARGGGGVRPGERSPRQAARPHPRTYQGAGAAGKKGGGSTGRRGGGLHLQLNAILLCGSLFCLGSFNI